MWCNYQKGMKVQDAWYVAYVQQISVLFIRVGTSDSAAKTVPPSWKLMEQKMAHTYVQCVKLS